MTPTMINRLKNYVSDNHIDRDAQSYEPQTLCCTSLTVFNDSSYPVILRVNATPPLASVLIPKQSVTWSSCPVNAMLKVHAEDRVRFALNFYLIVHPERSTIQITDELLMEMMVENLRHHNVCVDDPKAFDEYFEKLRSNVFTAAVPPSEAAVPPSEAAV